MSKKCLFVVLELTQVVNSRVGSLLRKTIRLRVNQIFQKRVSLSVCLLVNDAEFAFETVEQGRTTLKRNCPVITRIPCLSSNL